MYVPKKKTFHFQLGAQGATITNFRVGEITNSTAGGLSGIQFNPKDGLIYGLGYNGNRTIIKMVGASETAINIHDQTMYLFAMRSEYKPGRRCFISSRLF